MSGTLVMVDAQSGFWDSAQKVAQQLQNALYYIKYTGQNLIVLELSPRYQGRTHNSLKEITNTMNPNKVCYMEKSTNDGSNEVLEAMNKNKWELGGGINICGVNLCYCVAETAISLTKHTSVKLLRHAIACCPDCDCEGDDSNIIRRCKNNGILIDIHQT